MTRSTIIAIAERVGVSPATVSRALNNLPGVSPDKRRRILAMAAELDYHPNVNARGLQGQRANVVAYVVDISSRPTTDLFFFKDFIAVLADCCVRHGMDLLLHPAAGDDPTMRQVERLVRSHRVDGLLLSDILSDDQRIAYLTGTGVPFITFGRNGGSGRSYVDVDGVRGIYTATRHLIKRSHRRIAFLGLPLIYCCAIDRRDGYLQALHEYGLPVDPELVAGELTNETDTRTAIERLLAQSAPPSAFVAASDMLAIHAMSAAAQRGLRAGRDYAITGFDGLPLAAHTDPPLTTMRQPLDQVCDELIARLARIVAGEQEIEPLLLAPQLIIRGSS